MKFSFKQAILITITVLLAVTFAQDKKVMTFKDVMKFKKIKEYGLSDNANFFYYTANPDRGDAELFLKNLSDDKKFKFERGTKGRFSNDEKWFIYFQKPEFVKSLKDKKKKLKNNLVLVNTENGDTVLFKSVKSAQFTENSEWLSVHYNGKEKQKSGTRLLVKNLKNNLSADFNFVESFCSDSLSNYIAISISDTNKVNNGLFIVNLMEEELSAKLVDSLKDGKYKNLIWNKNSELAFTKAKNKKEDLAELLLWNGNLKTLVAEKDYPEGWSLPLKNKISWSDDNSKIYFGLKPFKKPAKIEQADSNDIYDYDQILDKKGLDVWHWDDPLIKTNEKSEYKKKKDKTYLTVLNLKSNKILQLADEKLPDVRINQTSDNFLGISSVPYLKLRTWEGYFSDYYIVNSATGERNKIAEKLYDDVNISPDGSSVVFFNQKEWFLFDTETKKTSNITETIKTKFDDEDHDYPREVNSYGFGGWINKGNAFLIYDKFDIWKFDSKTLKGVNLTKSYGRENLFQLRIIKIDRDKKYFADDETLLLSAYSDNKKFTTIYSLNLADGELNHLTENNKKFVFRRKAKNNNAIIFTRESYREYPDFWISDLKFDSPKKITNLVKQIKDYKWGTPELISWLSADGKPLQGIVIKPEDFDPDKKYPVLVYYYRFFTQRMYNFPDIVVNHRPNYGVYSSHDYVIFLPDIRFEIGRPGLSAVKCLVPGIHKLIDMGIADPDAVGLHGHSWSGYQTAFVVTQTDIFKCAVAGAPVSNMTSAYSGIRWGTGLARQFQYEKTQSRIGASLFESPHLYIENSPVFFAERINTPLLLQHGDIDEAVPWYQSIELYLAMRRLGKDCVFLQYRDEPHHLKKYPNKLDYSIKMKEYFDYHLKGETPAKWITEGVPYTK